MEEFILAYDFGGLDSCESWEDTAGRSEVTSQLHGESREQAGSLLSL